MQALVLGTAQFGAGYGITNANGRLADQQVEDILNLAVAHGLTAVDTASGYGDAQVRLHPWANNLTITTKVAGTGATALRGRLESCLEELRVATVDACLIHDWHELGQDDRQGAAEALSGARANGLVSEAGISAYEATDLESALLAFDHLDIVQVPANVLDRRLDRSKAIDRLARHGARIQVRSVFLQGLLAAPSETAQGRHPAVLAFHEACAKARVAPMAAALAHVHALPWATEIVVGVTSASELAQLLDVWDRPVPEFDQVELACEDINLIDPRNWSRPTGSVRLQS